MKRIIGGIAVGAIVGLALPGAAAAHSYTGYLRCNAERGVHELRVVLSDYSGGRITMRADGALIVDSPFVKGFNTGEHAFPGDKDLTVELTVTSDDGIGAIPKTVQVSKACVAPATTTTVAVTTTTVAPTTTVPATTSTLPAPTTTAPVPTTTAPGTIVTPPPMPCVGVCGGIVDETTTTTAAPTTTTSPLTPPPVPGPGLPDTGADTMRTVIIAAGVVILGLIALRSRRRV